MLSKPYTNQEYANFVHQANENNQRIEIFNNNAYALYDYEILQNGEIINITDTSQYKLSQFQNSIQYQHDAFNEFSREIVYQIQYNTALGNTTLILDLEEQLQAEQLAVIARINAITEEYNENNQQST